MAGVSSSYRLPHSGTPRPSLSATNASRVHHREELIARRIDEIHAAGSPVAVAATPGAARRLDASFCASF